MVIYDVEFIYNLQIEAENKEEAERKAADEWDEIHPLVDEINIEVTEIKQYVP